MKSIVILGGYGNFGKRIVENLASVYGITVCVAGRNRDRAETLISELQANSLAKLTSAVIDILSDNFEQQLKALSPFLVIHTSGPFQGQGYGVPESCARIGAHYIDLADDRRFVCDIAKLDDLANANNVLLVSGASSVPGLSSAVIDHYKSRFSRVDSVDIAIAPGNKAERGEATVRGILSYTGHAFSVFKNGAWQNAYGWMDARQHDFGGIIGKRWLANVDVPDLELFPHRYGLTSNVRFQAGLELPLLHLSMVGMAFMTKAGLVKNWSALTKPIVKTSNVFMPFGTDNGAMQVTIEGLDINGAAKTIKWTLYAPDGVGPYIPTLSTLIVAKKMLLGKSAVNGATPCIGQFSLADFSSYFDALGIYFEEDAVTAVGEQEPVVG